MKTGRNEPCPCGSGKKYKHCCYQKNHDNSNEEGLAIEEELRDKDHDEAYNESMLRGLLNFRMFFLGRKPHIKEYYKVRKMHGEICGAMIEYYDEGKFQLKIDSPFIADKSKKPDAARKRREIRLIDNHFDFETIEGLKGFQDRIIYRHALNMNCVTEDFIRLHRYRKPEKIEFLHSMLESRLSLYEITQTDKEEGFIWLRDVFTGAEHKITDIALSDARGTADIYLYTRVITYRDVKFSSGFTLIFIKADGFIQKFIELNRKDYKPEAELLRFSELYNHFTNDPEHYKIIVNELK